MNDSSLAIADRMQALDTLAAMQWPEAAQAVEALLVSDATPPALAESAFTQYGQQLFSMWMDSRKSPALAPLLKKALATPAMQMTAVDLVDALGDQQYTTELLGWPVSAQQNRRITHNPLKTRDLNHCTVSRHVLQFETAHATSLPCHGSIAAMSPQ